MLQLADVFENFRDICLENYKLDPAWYYTSPGLAWDAMLKRTGISLELLTDIDMLLMFKDGIRGGTPPRIPSLNMSNISISQQLWHQTASVKQTIDIWLKIMIVVNLRNI